MADDYANTRATAGRLTQDGSVTGRLEAANDDDWFRMTLVSGVWYTFELTSPGGIGYKDALQLYNSNGEPVAAYPGNSWEPALVRTFKPSATGTYFVGVKNHSYGAEFVPKAYTLRNTAQSDEAGDTEATARSVTVGQTVSARLQTTSDVDVFRIALEAGVTYKVVPTNGSGERYFGRLSLSGAGFFEKDVSGMFNGATFTATQSGDYYLTTGQSLYARDASYRFMVDKVADDHAANPAGAGTLVVGAAPTGGTLEVAGDRDWYGVTLEANTTYQFHLAGGAEGDARYVSNTARLQLIDAAGNVVKTAVSYTLVDAAHPHLLQFVPEQAGTYYLEVGDYDNPSGTYTLRAVVGEADDYGDTVDQATRITGQVTGKLSIPQDSDVFKMAVTQGHTYIVELTGQDMVDGARPIVAGGGLWTYGHDLQAFDKPGVTSYLVLRAGSTGDYAFTVNNRTEGGTAGYTLKVSDAGDDFADDRSTTGTLAVGGSTTGRLDYTGDADWFKVTLAAGGSYAFQLRGAAAGEGTLADGSANLMVWNTFGGAWMQDHGSGIYTLSGAEGGDYYVSVSPNTSSRDTPLDMTGSYTLHATALAGDRTAPTLTASQQTVGPYGRITLDFSEAVMRGDSDGYVTLRDASGTLLETYFGDWKLNFAGTRMTIDPTVVLKPGATYQVELPGGSVLDLAGNQLAAGSRLVSVGTPAMAIAGTAGDDYLEGKAAGGALDGGAGTDTAFFDFARTSYEIAVQGGTATVSSLSPGVMPAQLTGIERLAFRDGAVALDVEGVAGQAYRLYQAAFNRTPDQEGLGFWIAAMDQGVALTDVARDFIRSDEFVQRYGTASSDAVFLTNLYQNVLHRAPDQSGFDFWMDALARGVERATVLRDFSESSENHDAMAQVIANGFAYTPWG